MRKYKITRVEDNNLWDGFVNSSPQGTIFSLSHYLELAVDNYERYWIFKGNQIKGGLSLVLNDSKNTCVLDELVIHNGLMFAEDSSQKITKAVLERFDITEYVIDYLVDKYDSIAMALSPQFQDLRPFKWHNYHSKNLNDRFELDLRYTSYLDISSLKDIKDGQNTKLFHGLQTLRQRNIREALEDGANSHEEADSARLIEYYEELMLGQGENPEEHKLLRMRNLMDNLIKGNKATLIVSKNKLNEPIYAAISCWDIKRAYYLFGAPAPNAKERYKGTICFWESFHSLVRNGISVIDMEGVNSPQRGWFKLSFGGDLRPYYQVYKK